MRVSIIINHVPTNKTFTGIWQNVDVSDLSPEDIEEVIQKLITIVEVRSKMSENYIVFDGVNHIIIPPEIMKESVIFIQIQGDELDE